MKYKILVTDEFEDWLEEEPAKSRVQIAKRISNIREEGYFGDHKQVRDHVWELKWAKNLLFFNSRKPSPTTFRGE